MLSIANYSLAMLSILFSGRLNDEMESKLKDIESKWTAEFDQVKTAECEAIATLEQEKDVLVKEKEELEKEFASVGHSYASFFQLIKQLKSAV